MVLDDEDEGGWCRYLVVLYSAKIFLQPECLHGASIHHCAWCNAFSM